jgi:hypothetical protein
MRQHQQNMTEQNAAAPLSKFLHNRKMSHHSQSGDLLTTDNFQTDTALTRNSDGTDNSLDKRSKLVINGKKSNGEFSSIF